MNTVCKEVEQSNYWAKYISLWHQTNEMWVIVECKDTQNILTYLLYQYISCAS